ncbi:MAG: hypothetical protein LBJ12_02370 [Oscillospiraceae bacterium]|jgi:phage-related protein|nr:hypothetical protein [Oscillospiraceae bacterium]
MVETRFQTGDAAKVAGTFSGQLSQLSFNLNQLKVSVGNALIPIAKAVLPSLSAIIAALTRVAQAASYVMQLLFGKTSSADKAAKGNAAVAASANAAAAGETALAKATDKAARAQKKAGQLAGFDQLNVINTSDASAATTPPNAAPATITPTIDTSAALEEMDVLDGGMKAKLDELATKIQGTISKIKGFMSDLATPWKNIDFTNLVNAFDKVKTAAEPLISKVKDGLKWLNDNVLAPIAKWYVEEAAPASLNLLAGALDFLDGVLEILKPYAAWLWDNFLQPIRAWTGGLIVAILNTLADALSKIGNWIKDNQTTVSAFVIVIGTLVAAWEVTKLLSWLHTMGGLGAVVQQAVGMLLVLITTKTSDTAATITNTFQNAVAYVKGLATQIAFIVTSIAKWIAQTAAKIADTVASVANEVANGIRGFILQTAALIGSIIQWIAQTAAKIADTVATVAQTVATAAAAAATWLFNAAMAVLTSPITLIILAVAALVAGIILLVKNWDKVKEVAAAVWAKIVEIWKKVADWFKVNVIDKVVAVFQNIKTKITEVFQKAIDWVKTNWKNILTFILNPFAGVFKYLYDNNTKFREFIDGIAKKIKDAFVNAWNAIKDKAAAMWTSVKNGAKAPINGLLSMVENFINFFLRGINNIIAGINKISFDVPDWIPLIGGKKFGFNIGTLPNVSLPRLATGAVIPPRAEFAAILGDQKHGRNLEAPEGLIREILREELANLLGDGQATTINVPVMLDGREIARAVAQYAGHMQRIRGYA